MRQTTWWKKVIGVGTAAATALALVLGAGRAHAAPAATATAPAAAIPAAPNNKLALVLGLASPWGEMGLSYQRYVAPSFALETGVGIGATGGQLVVLPKLLLGSGNARFYVEGGPSVTLTDKSGAGVWASGEIGFESSFGGFVLGFGAGAGILVAGEVPFPICIDECSTMKPGTWMPEIRLTLGYAF